MNQVTKSLSKEEIARVEARQKSTLEKAIEKDPPRFVKSDDGKRELEVKLTFPVEYDGVVYETVKIRRPVMREWRAYNQLYEEVEKTEGTSAADLIDIPWISIPAVVLEELDFMDGTKVEAAQAGFFDRSSLPPDTNTEHRSPQE